MQLPTLAYYLLVVLLAIPTASGQDTIHCEEDAVPRDQVDLGFGLLVAQGRPERVHRNRLGIFSRGTKSNGTKDVEVYVCNYDDSLALSHVSLDRMREATRLIREKCGDRGGYVHSDRYTGEHAWPEHMKIGYIKKGKKWCEGLWLIG